MPDAFEMLEGMAMPRSHVEWGPDVDEYHEPLDDEYHTVAPKLHAIWKQFPTDIIQKIGNPMGHGRGSEPSYCILDESKRLEVTTARLKDTNLATTFTKVNVKYVQREEWANAFEHLFPPPNHGLPPHNQHYRVMRYYLEWVELMDVIKSADVIKVRWAIKQEFDKLAWAPAA
jgi:hypothetical protein